MEPHGPEPDASKPATRNESRTGSTGRHWVAATKPKEAVFAVQLQAGPEWRVKVTDQQITPVEARRLKLRPGDARRLQLK